MNKIKKTIYLLDINDYAPEIKKLTFPYIKRYAEKIGAEIYIIKERKFPNFPITYEKLQIYELAKKHKNDWNIYIDFDTLIHPETIDFTNYISKDTVLHNGADFANVRWRYDEYFLRDGRNIGSCNWMTIASDWCVDLWAPLNIPLKEALNNIEPTQIENKTVIIKEHLIDDYVLSRNIAKFGLKFKKITDLKKDIGLENANFFFHIYLTNPKEKLKEMKKIIDLWNFKGLDLNSMESINKVAVGDKI
jgi:hypothetical protein